MFATSRNRICVTGLVAALSVAALGQADRKWKDTWAIDLATRVPMSAVQYRDGVNLKLVLPSRRSTRDFRLTANPEAPQWRDIVPAIARNDNYGRPVPLPPTEIRSRWTKQNLYLLFSCPYDVLHLKPQPDISHRTSRLWEWDVAEAFIGSDPVHPERYREFEVSPQGEWLDLAIDLANPAPDNAPSWGSGFRVKARIDAVRKVWYGEMRIPLSAFDGKPSRLGLFRMQGKREILWTPTQNRSFHVPESFGTLQLEP